MYGILDGLRIVEASAFVAAPTGGLVLAQLGADVIRIDPLGGGVDAGRWPLTPKGASLYWASLNKCKRSILVDTKTPRGQEIVAELIARPGEDGGCFLTNLPPKGELAWPSLSKRRADVIMLRIVGHRDGSTALDYTVNSAVGYPSATGNARADAPVNHVFPAWDVTTGLTAALGLMAALRRRSKTGEGEEITLALSDVAYATVGNLGHIAEAMINGAEREAIGNDIYGAFGRDFATKDGRRVMVAAITARQWRSLLDAIDGHEAISHLEAMLGVDLSDEGRRFEARDSIAPVVARWIGARDYEEVRRAFERAAVCWGPYRSFLEMVRDDPRCSTDNPLFEDVEQPGIGTFMMPGSPLDFSRHERQAIRPAPTYGQHTDEILAEELGLSDARIGELRDARIVG
ncbi:MAG: CoA transferase [Ectothiorhodospiraceae bacterium AqS1]|nr:CoA transferase [Ectothiorhodospiraceae bacterium AqS1]